MEKESAWHDDKEFWTTFAPFMFPESRWIATPAEVDHLIALMRLDSGAKILDLGCGPGRHSLELTRRGYRVTGVDVTAAHLEKAREQAQAEGLEVEWVQDDMRRFVRANAFDATLNLFTSFGYFDDPAENLKVLANVFRSLKDGGKLILELMGKEVLARIFQPRDWDEQDDLILLQERRVSDNWNHIENRWILIQEGKRHEFNISHWIYSAAELTAMLKDCGFASVEICGDLAGAPYDHTASRLVAVAER
jgi:SAM-dependent methyltransferase